MALENGSRNIINNLPRSILSCHFPFSFECERCVWILARSERRLFGMTGVLKDLFPSAGQFDSAGAGEEGDFGFYFGEIFFSGDFPEFDHLI